MIVGIVIAAVALALAVVNKVPKGVAGALDLLPGRHRLLQPAS